MIPGLFQDLALRAMRVALGGLSQRQQAIANNVANVDTPGYASQRVTFEDALRVAATRLDAGQDQLRPVRTHAAHLGGLPRLLDVRPRTATAVDLPLRNDGNNVDIEAEMAALAETGIAYSGVTRLVSSKLGQLRTAISEGRR